MRQNKKLIATLLTFALLLLTCIGSISVFAESEDDTEGLITTEEAVATVSGCDLKSEDLVKAKVKQYGFSMLVPKDNVLTIDADASVFSTADYPRTYFMEQGCILYSYTDSDNYCAVMVFVSNQDSIYDYYGDYTKMSAAKRDELLAESATEDSSTEFVTINGRSYIQVTSNDNSTGDNYTQYQFTTVIDHKQYVIYIQTLNADANDKVVLNEMIRSIRLSGEGMQLSTADIILTIVCIILLIAVIVIYFFFYRANQFVKLGITNYTRLGFDLPKANKPDEKEVFDDDSNDNDDFDDDADYDDEAEEEDEIVEEDDDSDDDDSDERIIKD